MFSGILLSNFDEQFTNSYYHSIYDNSTTNGYDHDLGPDQDIIGHLAKVVETLARTIYKHFNKDPPNNFTANKTLINDLIYCYTVTAQCDMFKAVNGLNLVLPDYPLPQYVGVERSLTYHTIFTSRLLAYLTSKPIQNQKPNNCSAPEDQNVYHYIPMNGLVKPSWYEGNQTECDQDIECGYCYKTTMWTAPAVSPGICIIYY